MDPIEDYDFENAEDMVNGGWAREEFQDVALYARDVLLGSLTSFSEYYPVPGRPCDKMLGTLYHQPYNVYRYKNHTLFVPADISGDFTGAIDIGANDFGMHYSIISKHDDTLEGSFYQFEMPEIPAMKKVKFHKTFIRCTVDPATYQRELQAAGSDEVFFTGKRYMRFIESDPKVVRKSVDIIKTPNETKACTQDTTDIRSALDQYIKGEVPYNPVSDPEAPLFEIADSFDVTNIK